MVLLRAVPVIKSRMLRVFETVLADDMVDLLQTFSCMYCGDIE